MPEQGRRRSAARLFAPLALVLAVAAVLFVVQSSTQSDDGDGGRETAGQTTEQRPRDGAQPGRRQPRAAYTVKLNDTLGLIAEKTGVPVERLQALNPELDPQNLVVGQKIKLRE